MAPIAVAPPLGVVTGWLANETTLSEIAVSRVRGVVFDVGSGLWPLPLVEVGAVYRRKA